ncbi:MAG: hypothetical protein NTX57_05780 [Armatimonadetes bacterium]|nr:hypothetical protein [Armatimonadota bacterium]
MTPKDIEDYRQYLRKKSGLNATPLPRRTDGKLDTSKLTNEQLTKLMMGLLQPGGAR